MCFSLLPRGGATLAGTPLFPHLVPAAPLVGGPRTGNLGREPVGGARGPRWVGGPPGEAQEDTPLGLIRTDWEADEQKSVGQSQGGQEASQGPREAKVRGSGQLQGVVCRAVA